MRQFPKILRKKIIILLGLPNVLVKALAHEKQKLLLEIFRTIIQLPRSKRMQSSRCFTAITICLKADEALQIGDMDVTPKWNRLRNQR